MRLLGHPLHPMLVAFPLALLGLAPVCDVVACLGTGMRLAVVAHYLELSGLVGGVLAAVTGFADFYALDSPDPRLTKVALTHAGLALVTLSLFGLAFALRPPAGVIPPALPLVLELAGGALVFATGWFGGHLVFKFGVGVRHDPSQRVFRE
jgi:uncharacterized membrane protein